nr:PREDICTED: uncharacterized protein LOC105679575 [Linepithema humile]
MEKEIDRLRQLVKESNTQDRNKTFSENIITLNKGNNVIISNAAIEPLEKEKDIGRNSLGWSNLKSVEYPGINFPLFLTSTQENFDEIEKENIITSNKGDVTILKAPIRLLSSPNRTSPVSSTALQENSQEKCIHYKCKDTLHRLTELEEQNRIIIESLVEIKEDQVQMKEGQVQIKEMLKEVIRMISEDGDNNATKTLYEPLEGFPMQRLEDFIEMESDNKKTERKKLT